MHPADLQKEHNRLSQAYRNMTDDELEGVAAEAYDLTDIARQALSFEISNRGLRISLNLAAPEDETLEPLPPTDDGFVPDDRDIAVVYVAHAMDELLKVKTVLDQAHIECFLGEERTRDSRLFGSSFHGDVEMRVWLAQYNLAIELLTVAIPDFGKQEEPPDLEIRCPKCHSEGVIFEERDATSAGGKVTNPSKFHWVCDDCGHEWEDEGIAGNKPAPEPPFKGL